MRGDAQGSHLWTVSQNVFQPTSGLLRGSIVYTATNARVITRATFVNETCPSPVPGCQRQDLACHGLRVLRSQMFPILCFFVAMRACLRCAVYACGYCLRRGDLYVERNAAAQLAVNGMCRRFGHTHKQTSGSGATLTNVRCISMYIYRCHGCLFHIRDRSCPQGHTSPVTSRRHHDDHALCITRVPTGLQLADGQLSPALAKCVSPQA